MVVVKVMANGYERSLGNNDVQIAGALFVNNVQILDLKTIWLQFVHGGVMLKMDRTVWPASET